MANPDYELEILELAASEKGLPEFTDGENMASMPALKELVDAGFLTGGLIQCDAGDSYQSLTITSSGRKRLKKKRSATIPGRLKKWGWKAFRFLICAVVLALINNWVRNLWDVGNGK